MNGRQREQELTHLRLVGALPGSAEDPRYIFLVIDKVVVKEAENTSATKRGKYKPDSNIDHQKQIRIVTMNAAREPKDSDEEDDISQSKFDPMFGEIYKETVRLEIVRIVECETGCKGPKCHIESCNQKGDYGSTEFK